MLFDTFWHPFWPQQAPKVVFMVGVPPVCIVIIFYMRYSRAILNLYFTRIGHYLTHFGHKDPQNEFLLMVYHQFVLSLFSMCYNEYLRFHSLKSPFSSNGHWSLLTPILARKRGLEFGQEVFILYHSKVFNGF